MNRSTELDKEDRRVSALLTLGELYRNFNGVDIAMRCVRDNKNEQDFAQLLMPSIQAKLVSQSLDRELGLDLLDDDGDIKGYSLLRVVRAFVQNPHTPAAREAGFEMEVSRHIEKKVGRPPNGFYIPMSILARDFNYGSASEAGNLAQTNVAMDRMVDPLRNNLVLAKMGATVVAGLQGNVDIPRLSASSSASFQTEIAALSEGQPNSTLVSLRPKRVGGYVEPSRQALLQAGAILEKTLRDELMQTIAVQIQDAAINGSGAGANPRGIRNTAGIGSVAGGANGAQLAWTHLLDLESACANVDAEATEVAGYVTNAKVRRWAKNQPKGTNQPPFLWSTDNADKPLNGYRAGVTRTVPSNLTKGTSTTVCSSVLYSSDWSRLLIGVFGAPDVVVNPFSLATTGQVRISANVYMDIVVLDPAVFATMDDALTV